MTGFTNRQQKLMYYQRKRRRSLRNIPRLFQNGCFPAGMSTGSVPNAELDRPITFQIKADLAVAGVLFTWGSDVGLEITATDIIMTLPTGAVTIPHAGSGTWNLILSIRPADGAVQIWNQFSSLWRAEGLAFGGVWAQPDGQLDVGTTPVSPLGIFTAQLPRHFQCEGVDQNAGGPQPNTGDFWLNSTALFFMTGFPTPLFEGDC